MGFFNEEPKKLESVEVENKGFWHEAGILFLGAFIALVAWTGKGLVSTFNEYTSRNVKILVFILVPLILYSTIPTLRDTLTLSDKIAINIADKPSDFPNREVFYLRDNKTFVLGDTTYVTYKKYILSVKRNYCYLVPRGERLSLETTYQPIYAVGFENELTQAFDVENKKLPTVQYINKFLFSAHNMVSLLTFKKADVDNRVEFQYINETWNFMIENWKLYRRTFMSVSANWNQHAMICF